jgi:hypothetical protein
MHDVSSDEKGEDTYQYKKSKDFKRSDEEIVEPSEKWCKQTMRSKQAIENYLYNFDVDDYESNVDKQMQQTGNWTNHHFGLTHCNTRHQIPTATGLIGAIKVSSEFNVSTNLPHIHRKQSNTRCENDEKYKLGEYG